MYDKRSEQVISGKGGRLHATLSSRRKRKRGLEEVEKEKEEEKDLKDSGR